MFNYLTILVLVATLNLAAADLLCYDCDGGRECENPRRQNVRTVNCNMQYPTLQQGEKLVCLTLGITVLEGRGFNMHKLDHYRGCKVVPASKSEYEYCREMTRTSNARLNIRSCRYCESTRCVS